MSYILRTASSNMDGYNTTFKNIAAGNNKEVLSEYCKEMFGYYPGEKDDQWNKTEIIESDMAIVTPEMKLDFVFDKTNLHMDVTFFASWIGKNVTLNNRLPFFKNVYTLTVESLKMEDGLPHFTFENYSISIPCWKCRLTQKD